MADIEKVLTSARAKALREKIMDAALAAAKARDEHAAAEQELQALLDDVGRSACSAANKPKAEKPVRAALEMKVIEAPVARAKRRAGRDGGESIATRLLRHMGERPERAFTTRELAENFGPVPSAVLARLLKQRAIIRVGPAQYRIADTEKLDATPPKDRMSPSRKALLEALGKGPLSVDALCDKTGQSFGRVMADLDFLFETKRIAREGEQWRLA